MRVNPGKCLNCGAYCANHFRLQISVSASLRSPHRRSENNLPTLCLNMDPSPQWANFLKGLEADMSHPPRSTKNSSLEQWRIVFLCRLFWLSIAWLIAVFSLAILSGSHVIVVPYGVPLFFAGTTGGVFGLFSFPLRWLFQKQATGTSFVERSPDDNH